MWGFLALLGEKDRRFFSAAKFSVFDVGAVAEENTLGKGKGGPYENGWTETNLSAHMYLRLTIHVKELRRPPLQE